MRPRITAFGFDLLNTVEIQMRSNSSLAWITVFYAGEEAANNLAKVLDASIKNAYIVSIKNATRSLTEKSNHTHLALLATLERAVRPLRVVCNDSRRLFDVNRYLRGSELSAWQQEVKQKFNFGYLSKLSSLVLNPWLSNAPEIKQAETLLNEVNHLLAVESTVRHQHNDQHIQIQKSRFSDLFRHVETKPLTDEQMDASLIFDDANITIAAAGSGKTSVMVAKVAYALEAGLFREEEILALAYNKEAAGELQTRINSRIEIALGRKVNIEARTFHSLGNGLLYRAGDGKRLAVEKLDEPEGKRRFFAAFDSLVKDSSSFRDHLLQWIAYTRFPAPKLEPSDDDLEENEHRYQLACRSQLEKKLRGSISKFTPMIPTLDPSLKVRSLEEAAIANWLILHQMTHKVDFEYEQPRFGSLAARVGISLSKSGKQPPYKPDFTYRHPTKENVFIFHEHFGLGANGKAPAFLGGGKYEMQAARKRKAFREEFGWVEKKADGVLPFFETTSAQFRNGTIFEHLEQELTKRGINVKPLDRSKEHDLFAEFRESSQMEDLFMAFIARYRDCGLSERTIFQRAAVSDDPHRSKLFLQIAFELTLAVETEYRKHHMIDFSDMLRGGSEALTLEGMATKFKLILVDEFQDIANLRMDLVLKLAAKHPGSVLFFVGDDWQAINRFGGADISIFGSYVPERDNATNAPKRHRISACGRSTHAVLLSKTFRCAQGIADVSRALVMKNGGQIPKPVVAQILQETINTIRVVEHMDSAESRLEALTKELRRLAQLPRPRDKDGESQLIKVFILSRNKVDTAVPDGFESKSLNAITSQFKGLLEIVRDSLHGSKGLEADYTVIGGMDSGYRGFPSERPPDPLLELVLPPQSDPLEEERRLLYVGLTRSKRQTILLTVATRPSEYILELERMEHLKDRIEWLSLGIERKICPRCRRGTIQEPRSSSNHYKCSRQPQCGYRSERKF